MTSVTPRSAMTSVTSMINTEFSWAAEGARRATGAVQENSRLVSSQPIVVFGNRQILDLHEQLLAAHVDRRDHVFVDPFGRQGKLLAKDIQQRITADETHQMVTARCGLRQRVPGRGVRVGKANQVQALLKHRQRRFPFQLAIAIAAVVLLLKEQRLRAQFVSAFHPNLSQEPTSVMVIEFFHHAVAPRLSQRYEPGFYSLAQAQTNQTPHATRVTPTAIEDRFVVHLLMLWQSQTTPVRPDSVNGMLPGFGQRRRHRTTSGAQVDTVQTVEAHRPIQVTRSHKIRLMHLVDMLATQLRILFPLGLVATSPPMCQAFAINDAADSAQAREWGNTEIFQLPGNRLCAAKQTLVVKMQTRQLDGLDNLRSNLAPIAMRTSAQFLIPFRCGCAAVITRHPFVNPATRVTQRLGDGRQPFAFQVTLHSKFPIATLFLLHAFLLQEKGTDDHLNNATANWQTVFQRTVHDVMALFHVTDVVAFIN